MVAIFFLFVVAVKGCVINDALVKKVINTELLYMWDVSSEEIGVKLVSGAYLRVDKDVLCALKVENQLVIF